MFIFLIVIHVIASLVLVLTILLQSGRGGGLSESFGSSSTSTIFGTNTSTFLQRATSACAIIFLATSLSLAIFSSHQSKSLMDLKKIKAALPEAARQELPVETTMDGLPVAELDEVPPVETEEQTGE